MTYKQINDNKAKRFYKQNPNYNVYLCNPKNATLLKVNGQNTSSFCRQFSYLINSDKNCIQISQFCKNTNQYDVIFISPDQVDKSDKQMIF